jgi:hypothetical protein
MKAELITLQIFNIGEAFKHKEPRIFYVYLLVKRTSVLGCSTRQKKSYIHAIKHSSKDLKITLSGCAQHPEILVRLANKPVLSVTILFF